MPLYEYQCDACGHRFERIQKFSDPPVSACPACGGEVRKLLSSPAIQFKGSGFYITDYARSGSKDASGKKDKGGDGAAPAEKKADTPAASSSTSDSSSSSSGKTDSAKPAAATSTKD